MASAAQEVVMKRKIIRIDEAKCTGCGLCIPNCPEGALRVIDGKVRLVSDLFCDGLGACIGHCPEGAITTEERDAAPYDERKVMENIVPQGENTIAAHLEHLKAHDERVYLEEALVFLRDRGIAVPRGYGGGPAPSTPCGCPGATVVRFASPASAAAAAQAPSVETLSELRHWPVQLMLVPPNAPYLDGADLLIAADCVPFAYADFHRDLLRGKTLLVGCPKFDDLDVYRERLAAICRERHIRSITYAHMEVPCCSGLIAIIQGAIAASGKAIPFHDVTVGIRGARLS